MYSFAQRKKEDVAETQIRKKYYISYTASRYPNPTFFLGILNLLSNGSFFLEHLSFPEIHEAVSQGSNFAKLLLAFIYIYFYHHA